MTDAHERDRPFPFRDKMLRCRECGIQFAFAGSPAVARRAATCGPCIGGGKDSQEQGTKRPHNLSIREMLVRKSDFYRNLKAEWEAARV